MPYWGGVQLGALMGPTGRIGVSGGWGLHLKNEEGLLQTENVLLKTKDGLLNTEDNRSDLRSTGTHVSTTLGH